MIRSCFSGLGTKLAEEPSVTDDGGAAALLEETLLSTGVEAVAGPDVDAGVVTTEVWGFGGTAGGEA